MARMLERALEIAKEMPRSRRKIVTDEDTAELLLAWANGTVPTMATAKALGYDIQKCSTALAKLTAKFLRAFRDGYLEVRLAAPRR